MAAGMDNTFLKLEGAKVNLQFFNESCICTEYINWLNDPEVVFFSNQKGRQHTAETSLNYLSSFYGTENLFLAIRLNGCNKLIGTINAYLDLETSVADMGIMIGDKTQWGKGIGLDAWNTLLNFLLGRADILKITGGTLRPNQGMVNVMIKSGMYLNAVKTGYKIHEGCATDVLQYAKEKDS